MRLSTAATGMRRVVSHVDRLNIFASLAQGSRAERYLNTNVRNGPSPLGSKSRCADGIPLRTLPNLPSQAHRISAAQ